MRELVSQESQSQTGGGLSKLDYQRQLSKRIGELWRNEAADIKAAFYEKSQQAAREHAERYPEYRYKPKPLPKKAREEASTSALLDKTPERKGDTDFAPGDLSGPLSGSGSGSGRKRASLDGTRAKASPYSAAASRHHRTSSGSPTSPSIRRTSNGQLGHTLPVLLYAASDTRPYGYSAGKLQRSVSQKYTHERKAKVAARRSLDGHTAQPSSSTDAFNTLVPQHLRESPSIFLAPQNLPPLPIGQAITTDDRAPIVDEDQRPRPQRPKMSLAQAVKQALPPERRALLHASLVRRGLVPATEVSQGQNGPERVALDQSLVQSDSYSTLDQSSSQSFYQPTQESTTTLASYPDPQPSLQPQLSSDLDPANQASLNITMSSAQAQRYGGLADWTQPVPSWLDQSLSQGTDGSHSSTAQNVTHSGYTESSQTSLATQQSYIQPGAARFDSFASLEVGQYAHPALSYPITAANSAIVALSDPNDFGQVQGHFYGLDGEFIAQGTGEMGAHAEEEERQQRAVQELLRQMMDDSVPEGGGAVPCGSTDYPVQSDGHDAFHQGYQQVQTQWQQNWQTEVHQEPNATRPYVEPSEVFMCSDYLNQPSYSSFEQTLASTQTVGSGQESADSLHHFSISSSVPAGVDRNFSLPLGYEVPTQHPGQLFLGAGEGAESFAQGLSLETAGLVSLNLPTLEDLSQMEKEMEGRQSVEQKEQIDQTETRSRGNKGLRSWKAHQLSSIKEKFAKIKQRHAASGHHSAQGTVEDGTGIKKEQ